MLAITHADEKANANSALNKHSQNSSYKVQPLQAAVVLQSGSKRLRSLVADLVPVLQNSCWPSRTPTKKQTRIQH
jgi:lambda repressor-like predicted transcriptional regulator